MKLGTKRPRRPHNMSRLPLALEFNNSTRDSRKGLHAGTPKMSITRKNSTTV
jgi:hypothetical protein